ncbi:tripartite-type tricarboxylate transporter receptor subunit TctC [Azospirillum lipoferum]|uniref:Tripartite tricarboxylate transporter substrate binding protein n=1 Tax=Azospirillum lipoferum TaxID=193 RepID=A0A5A9GBH2_AZOLI|nr:MULTISPECIES: tripartite tricarboxylate transporter substrate binding protein [Azospirillum]KAA0591757.1 tripartite tricarboxylate transporter substrate binding protein [Azospirillum lipoferum]MCP1614850.1 tripartite-type tricarboxylate transporter receptor subunit TctC [Azospirillum lipoferum]MDW5536399.1 tripartite tricarboxylate transporter substrate binding protein [Azospirillum sp. NL1]
MNMKAHSAVQDGSTDPAAAAGIGRLGALSRGLLSRGPWMRGVRRLAAAVGIVTAGLVATVVLAAPGAAWAAYPEKPISLIVGYAAGGGSDFIVRSLAPFIEKELGGSARVIVMNRPGAGGEIGFAAIADANPDGYTIGLINSPNVVTIPIERHARFSLDRLDPLYNLVDDPGSFVVHKDSPFQTLADVAAFAKANPNNVTVGTTGIGSDDHLAMLMFQRLTQTQLTHVPFPGSADAHRALLGRHIQVTSMNIGESARAREGDPIRILGVMTDQRSEQAPDVPTFKELGFDVKMSSLRGLAAPMGLPPDIRAKLVDAIAKAVQHPEFQDIARKAYQPLRLLPPDQYAAELKTQEATFRTIWKETPWLK